MNTLGSAELVEYILKEFAGLKRIMTWGEISFFYNPDNLRPRGIYFCTIKEKDSLHDQASSLNRDYLFRFNFGITKLTFMKLFGSIPKRPAKGSIIEGPYDFTSVNSLCPHPIYGWMCWVSIINPSVQSLDSLRYLLNESYQITVKKYTLKM